MVRPENGEKMSNFWEGLTRNELSSLIAAHKSVRPKRKRQKYFWEVSSEDFTFNFLTRKTAHKKAKELANYTRRTAYIYKHKRT